MPAFAFTVFAAGFAGFFVAVFEGADFGDFTDVELEALVVFLAVVVLVLALLDSAAVVRFVAAFLVIVFFAAAFFVGAFFAATFVFVAFFFVAVVDFVAPDFAAAFLAGAFRVAAFTVVFFLIVDLVVALLVAIAVSFISSRFDGNSAKPADEHVQSLDSGGGNWRPSKALAFRPAALDAKRPKYVIFQAFSFKWPAIEKC